MGPQRQQPRVQQSHWTVLEEEVAKDDIPKKEKVLFEIMRTKGKTNIVIRKGKLSKRREWIHFRLEGVWRTYFPNHFIKRTIKYQAGVFKKHEVKIVQYLCRFNLYYSEALRKGQDVPDYDEALESQLLMEWHSQYKKAIGAVASLLTALARDRSIQMLIALSFLFGIPIGAVLWPPLLHPPNTIVHWVMHQ